MTAPAWGEYWPTSSEQASRSCLAMHSEAAGAAAGAARAAVAHSAALAIRVRRRNGGLLVRRRVLTAPNERRARNWCSCLSRMARPGLEPSGAVLDVVDVRR